MRNRARTGKWSKSLRDASAIIIQSSPSKVNSTALFQSSLYLKDNNGEKKAKARAGGEKAMKTLCIISVEVWVQGGIRIRDDSTYQVVYTLGRHRNFSNRRGAGSAARESGTLFR